jgi:hypothetical protein
MTRTEANLEVEVIGSNKTGTNWLEDDEVLIVRDKKGKSKVSAFGSCIPAEHSLSEVAASGGVYVWNEKGKSKKGKTTDGRDIPVGGLCVRPGETVEVRLGAGSEIEIGIAGTAKTDYQMFDDMGTAKRGDKLRIKGVGVHTK